MQTSWSKWAKNHTNMSYCFHNCWYFKNVLNTLEILYYHLTLFKVNRRFLKHLGHFNKSHLAWWRIIHSSHKQGMYTITPASATVLSSVSFSKKFRCPLQWPWIFRSVDRAQDWELSGPSASPANAIPLLMSLVSQKSLFIS